MRPNGAKGSRWKGSYSRPSAPLKAQEKKATSNRTTASLPPESLSEALESKKARWADGSKLNAVGKKLKVLGPVPQSVASAVQALYLSQNEFESLEGIHQFPHLRLLSLGNNRIASFDALAYLSQLPRLRHLNLTGNPVSNQPNYRFRLIDLIPSLQVLDNKDIRANDKALSASIASQDRARRDMLVANHLTIMALRRIGSLLKLHREFNTLVLAGFFPGQFDKVPTPDVMAINVSKVLQVWQLGSNLSLSSLEELKLQMAAIVVRTRAKMKHQPRERAKELLLKMGGAANTKSMQRRDVPHDVKEEWNAWEEAYANVIALQQQTIVSLRGECDKHLKDGVHALRKVLTMELVERRRLVGFIPGKRCGRYPERKPLLEAMAKECWKLDFHPNASALRASSGFAQVQNASLPPEQTDPETEQAVRKKEVSRPTSPVGSTCHERETHEDVEKEEWNDLDQAEMMDILETLNFDPMRTLESHGNELFTHIPPKAHTPSSKVKTTTGRVRSYGMQRSKDPQRELSVTPAPKSPGKLSSKELDIKPKEQASCNIQSTTKDKVAHDDGLSLPKQNSMSKLLAEKRAKNSFQAILERERNAHIQSKTGTSNSYLSQHQKQEDHAMLLMRKHGKNEADDRNAHDNVYETTAKSSQLDASESPDSPEDMAVPLHRYEDGQRDGSDNLREEREEKYLSALIASEQRELDLRNQINLLTRKLERRDRMLSLENTHDDEAKEEFERRIHEMSGPIIQRKFFIRWIRYALWCRQVHHIHRKRHFVLQYDIFWRWRRKVWVQDQLRRLHARHLRKVITAHFTEWTNMARITIIALHAQSIRRTECVQRVLLAWKQYKDDRHRIHDQIEWRQVVGPTRMRDRCFRAWIQHTHVSRQLSFFHKQRLAEYGRRLLDLVFCRWRMHVLAYARPLSVEVNAFRKKLVDRWMWQVFIGWKRQKDIKRFQRTFRIRRFWKAWQTYVQVVHCEHTSALVQSKCQLKKAFSVWRTSIQDVIASRRSLCLAERYVHRRRLRKLWFYWSFYTSAKRKHVQGCSKALKHYYMHLIRQQWRRWKQHTNHHKACRRQQKFGVLQVCFHALKDKAVIARTHRQQRRLAEYLRIRCGRRSGAQVLQAWHLVARQRRCSKRHGKILSTMMEKTLLARGWRGMHTQYLSRLRRQNLCLKEQASTAAGSKRHLERDLLHTSEECQTLVQDVSTLTDQLDDLKTQLGECQQQLMKSEERCGTLEEALDQMQQELEEERHVKQMSMSELEEKYAKVKEENTEWEKENRVLCEQVDDLSEHIKELDEEVEVERNESRTAREEMEETSERCKEEVTNARETVAELEQKVEELQSELSKEQSDRDELTEQLQEYENNVRNTCDAIAEQQLTYESEKEELRREQIAMTDKWKEECVRSNELQRIVQEKNHRIFELTQQLESDADCSRDWKGEAYTTHRHCDVDKLSNTEKRNADKAVKPVTDAETSTSQPTVQSLLADVNRCIDVRTKKSIRNERKSGVSSPKQSPPRSRSSPRQLGLSSRNSLTSRHRTNPRVSVEAKVNGNRTMKSSQKLTAPSTTRLSSRVNRAGNYNDDNTSNTTDSEEASHTRRTARQKSATASQRSHVSNVTQATRPSMTATKVSTRLRGERKSKLMRSPVPSRGHANRTTEARNSSKTSVKHVLAFK